MLFSQFIATEFAFKTSYTMKKRTRGRPFCYFKRLKYPTAARHVCSTTTTTGNTNSNTVSNNGGTVSNGRNSGDSSNRVRCANAHVGAGRRSQRECDKGDTPLAGMHTGQLAGEDIRTGAAMRQQGGITPRHPHIGGRPAEPRASCTRITETPRWFLQPRGLPISLP
ncbi:hypothetical protein C6495_19120 [Candidatus Poribacteria bacterium]|nr:MAG: hypothetical protein C6495_19120 [Candidatus Poribacteria bacterium]